jgi:1A family penicillin-binding protein
MRLFQDIIIVVGKLLILIGDSVIAVAVFFRDLILKAYNSSVFFFARQKSNFLKFRKITKSDAVNPSRTFMLPKSKIGIPKLKRPNIHLRLRHRKRGRPRHPLVIPFRSRFKYIFYGSFLSFVFFFLPMVLVIFLQNLPSPEELSRQEIAQTTKIYDRNGTLLYQIYANQNRTNVPLSQIPEHFKHATIAIEDKNFYSSPGIDIEGILRSAIADLSGKPLQGGSTITQQLIKARLLTPERSIQRKVKEIILALWAQRIYSKDQILEMYFNQVPYGGTAWGAEAAAQTYFGKRVSELDLAESAFLAGIPQAPTIYSPYSGEENAWKGRQRNVLRQMVELDFISQEEADKALAKKLSFKPHQQIIYAPHFVMHIKNLLIEKYGLPVVERGGLNVITSLDIKTQEMAQKIVTAEVENAGNLNFTNAAALITNPKNGDIIAMVGGKDYYDPKGGNYNVTTALRQPGSTIKVVTYSAALMNGFTAASTISDTAVSFASAGAPAYTPVNYDGRFHGNVTLRNALGNSLNIPAVKTLNQVGIPAMVSLAEKMGVKTWDTPENYGLALTLGSAEVRMTDLAVLYGSLANKGKRVELNPILKITNYQGAVLEEKTEVKERIALPEEVAYIISNILADNNARSMSFGMNSPLRIPGHTVSVKTGTTDNKRDNWTIGYTPNLLTAVWVGNNDNTPMNPNFASGISGAAPIWNKIMTNILAKSDPKDELYAPPANIVVKSCGGRNEYFVKGTDNIGNCRPISINDRNPNLIR